MSDIWRLLKSLGIKLGGKLNVASCSEIFHLFIRLDEVMFYKKHLKVCSRSLCDFLLYLNRTSKSPLEANFGQGTEGSADRHVVEPEPITFNLFLTISTPSRERYTLNICRYTNLFQNLMILTFPILFSSKLPASLACSIVLREKSCRRHHYCECETWSLLVISLYYNWLGMLPRACYQLAHLDEKELPEIAGGTAQYGWVHDSLRHKMVRQLHPSLSQ